MSYIKASNKRTQLVSHGVKIDIIPLTNRANCNGIFPPHRWTISPMGKVMMQYPKKNEPNTIS